MFRALSSLILLVSAINAVGQGTVFQYQGRLNDNGQPANGTYDFVFKLYDSTNVPGNTVSSPVASSGTQVANGLFTANLDFWKRL
jgi:hypothetical protein